MHEFDSVSVSTYEASSLAAKLTEKSGEGWDIVAIVPTGSDITAFLKREGSSGVAADTAGTDSRRHVPTPPSGPPPPASRPAGARPRQSSSSASSWGSSTDAGTTGAYGAAAASAPADSGSTWGSSAATPAAAAPAAAPTTPSGARRVVRRPGQPLRAALLGRLGVDRARVPGRPAVHRPARRLTPGTPGRDGPHR